MRLARRAALRLPDTRHLTPPDAQEGWREERKRERERSEGEEAERRAKAPRQEQGPLPPPPLTAEEEEAAAAARREEEQAKLDAEMERRRRRVEQWQAARRQQQESAGLGPGEGAGPSGVDAESVDCDGAAPAKARGWTLDGEGDEEEEEGTADALAGHVDDGDGDTRMGAADAAGTQPGSTQPSTQPPERSLSAPPSAAAPPHSQLPPPPAAEEEEVDPLDAFMAATVLPEVQRLNQEDVAAYAQETAGYAAAAAQQGAPAAPEPAAPPDARMADSDEAAAHAPPSVQAPPLGAPSRPTVLVRPSGFKGLIIKSVGAPKAAPAEGLPAPQARGALRRAYGQGSDSSSSDGGDDSDEDDEAWAKKALTGKQSKADKLGVVDHATVDYPSFRKAFYIESAEVARMSAAEVAALRKGSLDGVKCRGKEVPKPLKTWTQAGLSQKILDVLKKQGYEKPMPIQAQALPIIMSGRDCIGVAKTGSGKTLAFLLPLLRHAKDQAPLAPGDGPIGLIMAPTRELVTQIGRDAKRFGAAVGMAAACVYGGSGVAAQIGDLKRGAEIVVCTPGRMIDIVASSNGRVSNFKRVTYLVLDEADRMFDMGFEPQIQKIIANTRPDRQTVMFSATFPHAMELLARAALNNPVEIQVGGRSVVNSDIEQFVEIRPEEDRFLRLLELLGQWYEAGKILVFVQTQDKCDSVFRDLLRAGYPCLSLHGGKEQSDRECTIADFKSDVCNVLVATSVAARGLDVKDLRLVVNYDAPNHHEEYVHRCGRTGRAGAKGTAVTFLGPDEERFAPDLVKALKESGRAVPEDLAALAESFARKRKEGTAQAHGSGFGGSGFKFHLLEDTATKKAQRKQLAIQYGADPAALDASDDEEEAPPADEEPNHGIVQTRGAAVVVGAQPAAAAASGAATQQQQAVVAFQQAAAAAMNASLAIVSQQQAAAARGGFAAGTLMPIAGAVPAAGPLCPPPPGSAAALQAQAAAAAAAAGANATPAQRAAAFAAQLNASRGYGSGVGVGGGGDHFEVEIEINDFPQHARWKVTHKDSLREIQEFTGAVITTKGQFVPPGKPLAPGDRKLYLLVEGHAERSVREAKVKIRELLEAAAAQELQPGAGGPGMPARYTTF